MAKCKGCDYVLKALLLAMNIRLYLVVIAHHVGNLFLVLIGELHLVLNGDPFKDHLILGERARLVGEDIPDPAQLLGNGRVTGDGALNGLVVVDPVGVEELGKVQVDPHRDRDD